MLDLENLLPQACSSQMLQRPQVFLISRHASVSSIYPLGSFTKTLFQKENKGNPPRITLGVDLNGSKKDFSFR